MFHFFRNHRDLSLWLFFTVLATFILFFISPDSCFNGMHGRWDSAWFFMCGKAWMQGLVPYVDFSDSKGPLLWLIYGIGYLLSHTNYLGVYWISCFWYGLTFFFTYKTAHIFIPETRKAVFCTILMALAFFNPWFHNEIRAEDFALLFMMISLYELCRLAWAETQVTSGQFFVLGCCFSALLLIKFNLAVMQAILILAALAVCPGKQLFWRHTGACVVGACIVVFPFLVCFLIQGNLHAFVQEYFIRTWQTVSQAYLAMGATSLLTRAAENGNLLIIYLCEWTCVLDNPKIGALLLLLILGGILFSQQQPSHKYLILLVSLGIFAVTIRHNILYYFQICAPFLLFLLVGLLRNAPMRKIGIHTALSLITVCTCIATHVFFHNYKILAFRETPEKQGYYQMAQIIAQVKNPTIVNACDHETGIGTPGEALPAGKYWAYQTGSTPQMIAEHINLVLSGKADFVYVRRPWLTEQRGLTISEIEQAGYRIVCTGGEFENSVLLSKIL